MKKQSNTNFKKMGGKSWIWIIIVLVIMIFFIILRMNEDSWILDSRGVWIKHGNPSEIPDYVLEQQTAIDEAIRLYSTRVEEGTNFHLFSSDKQPLGISSDGIYGLFVVWIPENGTLDSQRYENLYETGNIKHFILLDREGNVVKILDIDENLGVKN